MSEYRKSISYRPIMKLWLGWIKKIIDIIYDLIFPRSSVEYALENLTPAKLHVRFKGKNLSNKVVTALFPYKHKFIKEMIWLFKYKKNQQALNLFAKLLGETIIAEFEEILPFCSNPKIIIIPIPTTHNREKERGHNSLIMLSEKVIDLYGSDFFEIAPDILIFKTEIKRQTNCKNKKEREENMKNAFMISNYKNNLDFSGRVVAIIDDVTTTGATFREARRVLSELDTTKNPILVKSFSLAH